MKKILFTIAFLFSLSLIWGQVTLSKWALNSDASPNSVDANVTATNFDKGPGIAGSIIYAATGARVNGWSLGLIDLSDYFEITIHPNSGYNLVINEVLFGERRSGTGIHDYQVRWSIDDFTTQNTISTVNVPDNILERSGDITNLNIFVNNGEIIKIRFYGYNAEGSTGTWRINDNTLELKGSTSTSAPIITNITQTPIPVTSTDAVSISADVTDFDGIFGVELHWGTTMGGPYNNTINMSNVGGDTYTTESNIPTQTDGTIIYYEIYALNNNLDETVSDEQSYVVYEACSQLFISEYAQGTGNYLEIYNPSGGAIDMANYQIWRGDAGGDWNTATIIQLENPVSGPYPGPLVPGNVFVLARDAEEVSVASQYDLAMDYDGNDNIGLAWNGGSGTVFYLIDAVGDANGDPAIGWDVAGTAAATVGHTLVRKSTVAVPNADWTSSAGTDIADSEWLVWDYTTTTWLHHVSDCQLIPLMFVSDTDQDPIIIGSTLPMEFNSTLFPNTMVGGNSSVTFEIWNAGNTALNLTENPMVSIITADPNDFTLTATPTSPVGILGQFTSFEVTFTPTSLGTKTAVVSIANDNPFENPFTFTIGGEGTNFLPCEIETFGATLALQDFDETMPEWTYTSPDLPFFNDNNDFYGIHDGDGDSDPDDTGVGDTSDINYPNITNDFLFVNDLNSPSGTADFATIVFGDVDTSNAVNVVLSFDYDVFGFDGGDDVKYELYYDGIAQGEVLFVDGQNGGGVTLEGTETINIPDLVNSLSFTISIKQEGQNDSAGFDNFKVVGDILTTTTWSGTAWSDGLPSMTTKVIIAGDYSTAAADQGNLEACACQINSGATLNVASNTHILIGNEIEAVGDLVVAHEGSVVQQNNDAVNSGTGFEVHKTTTPYNDYDYIYWSSPVTAEDIDVVFANNPLKWSHVTANYLDMHTGYPYPQTTGTSDSFDDDDDEWQPASGVMMPGVGYIAMGAASTFPLPNPLVTNPHTPQSVVFDGGVLNNGEIVVPVTLDKYHIQGESGADTFHTNANLIGNPYASAIDIKELYLANDGVDDDVNSTATLTGAFKFWKHVTPLSAGNPGPDLYNFDKDDYAIVTTDGLIINTPDASDNVYEFIASGQSFKADVLTPGNMVFNNLMRVTGPNTSFKATQVENLDRLWLQLKDTNDKTRSILVGFYDNATNGYDANLDGQRVENGANLDFYSVIPEVEGHFAIQMLEIFEDDKVIALGLEIVEAGNYQIAIDHLEGIFTEGQQVYIYDNETNIVHNLIEAPYTFTTEVGEAINDRLTLRFVAGTNAIEEWSSSSALLLAQHDDFFEVSTSNQADISRIDIYDMLGQKLMTTIVDTTTVLLPSDNYKRGTVLILKVSLKNGQRITQKVIKF